MSWVEASSGQGNIFVRLVPDSVDGDLHVDLQTGVGDVTIFVPERMKASVEMSIQRPTFDSQRIISDFPLNSLAPANTRALTPVRTTTVLNGGGNPIKLHTSLGKIFFRKN